MIHQTYPFKDLPFSQLFKKYIYEFSELQSFYTYNSFDDVSVEKRAHSLSNISKNNQYVDALTNLHKKLGINQSSQLEKLRNPDALTIVTGQQLGVYGGPLFTIYKTISAIILASKWQKKLNKPVIPVFWLADEDHDFDEIKWFGVPANNEFNIHKYDKEDQNYLVSDIVIEEQINRLKEQLKEDIFDTDFSEDLWKLFDSLYKKGNTFRQAFAQLIDALFGKHGVLIVGSNFKEIKQLSTSVFIKSVEKSENIYSSLEEQSNQLSKKFHAQVVLNQSNLFFIDDDGKRVKIEKSDNTWSANSKVWTTEELIDFIRNNAERFSPNVFLRPILQDTLLPTIGYVAGPGELAYYGQMKELYPNFGLEMPVIFPRLSVSLIESGIDRIMNKLPFKFHEYNQRIEDLVKAYVTSAESTDVEAIFKKWKQEVEEISKYPRDQISNIDGSLNGLVGKSISNFTNDLDKLKGRVYRSIKQQEDTQIQRIEKIKAQLFPGDGLQERQVSFMYFMNKYGLDIWDDLIEIFSHNDVNLKEHHIVKL